jgi:hypothetical protein
MPGRSAFEFVSSFSENINQLAIYFSQDVEKKAGINIRPLVFCSAEKGPRTRGSRIGTMSLETIARKGTSGSNGDAANRCAWKTDAALSCGALTRRARIYSLSVVWSVRRVRGDIFQKRKRG